MDNNNNRHHHSRNSQNKSSKTTKTVPLQDKRADVADVVVDEEPAVDVVMVEDKEQAVEEDFSKRASGIQQSFHRLTLSTGNSQCCDTDHLSIRHLLMSTIVVGLLFTTDKSFRTWSSTRFTCRY